MAVKWPNYCTWPLDSISVPRYSSRYAASLQHTSSPPESLQSAFLAGTSCKMLASQHVRWVSASSHSFAIFLPPPALPLVHRHFCSHHQCLSQGNRPLLLQPAHLLTLNLARDLHSTKAKEVPLGMQHMMEMCCSADVIDIKAREGHCCGFDKGTRQSCYISQSSLSS